MKRQNEQSPASQISQLQKELAANTAELTRKNRDLEIEAALERVRARAMAMQSSDELSHLVTTLFNELSKLHFSLARCFIWIINADALSATTWMADPGADATSYQWKYLDHPYYKGIIKAWKERNPKWAYELKGKEKRVLDDIIFNLPSLKDTPEVVKAAMRAADKAVLSFSFSNFGGLQVDGPEPLSEDNLDILARFSKVFDQTYTRFSDLKKAEAQAREALIEGALERVRSRAMAMHKTDELRDAAELLYKEVTGLGISTHTVCYVLVNAENKTGLYYGINPVDGQVTPPTVMPHTETNVMRAIWASWLKQEPVCFIALDPKASVVHQTYIGKLIAAAFAAQGVAPEFTLESFLSVSPERVHIYSLNFKQGYLFVVGGTPLAVADVDILTRFTKVFELTYTRFLDLKKAEGQAREGRIELALERVRARTMAMRHSDELAETAYILFQQFRELGENPDQATIGIINEAEGVIEYWVTIYGNQTNRVFKFPVDEPNVTRKIYDAWKAQEKSLVIDLGGQALYDFSKFRESMGGAGYNEGEQRRIINVAFFSKGLINVQSTVERSIESLRLLERFANVFEGTYTRFLDLKKAEAQAREAQIELALERVRARAMAMRDSKELSGMVSTVFSELTKLDFALTRCAIVIADSGSGSWMIWMANSEPGQPPISFYRKSLDHPYPNAATEEWKKRNPKWVYHLKGAEKKGMDDYYANSEEVAHLSSVIKQAMDMPESIILSHSFNNFGYLRADSLEFLSEANLDILYRFAKVFDLGYTRFTDIKQAEAQAREAQIELALERVRAKTMAMQHSDELLETSQVVFQQLRDLGETADQISIAIVKEDEGIFDLFATIYGTQMVRVVHPKIDDHFIMGKVYKNWKAKKKSFVVELGGEELRRYNILRNQLGGQNYYNENVGADDRWNVSCASFSRGILSFSSSTEPTMEAGQLLERFAKVFDSTYTRFLDLQKAEAQARESQIQLALERVRARTMAMQKSDELAETVSLLFKQLLGLGIRQEQIRTCGIVTFDDNKPVGEQWVTETNGEVIPQSFMVPYTDVPAYVSIYGSWKKGEKFKIIHLQGELLKQHFRYLDKHANVPIRDVVARRQAKEIYNHVLFFSQGYLFIITKEALPGYHDVFKRFGAVFQQSYTRFLDLKKAEAQAREGQVQLAMERVRARTMAMQRSDELMEASHLLDSQVRALGIETRGCAFNIYGENESTEWFGLETGPLVYKTPREEAFLLYYEAGQRGDSLYINEFAGDACKAHYEYLCTLPDVGGALKKMRENGQPFPAYQIDHVVYFKFGYLLFITFGPVPEAHDIFKRFAAVFEQTYTRFLDLQKAEEQARESQIEAALERVRSRSMGMQKSDELKEVIQIIYEQFVHLNISIEHTGFVVDYRAGDDWHFWIADHLGSPNKLTIPDFDSAWCNDFNAAKEKGIDFFATNLTFDEKNKFYRDLFDRAPGMPEEAKELIFSKPGFAGSTVLLENVALYIENFEGIPYTDGENATLMRFGKVFQQTYTRFLDLQQAEAQTREAKIEAGLERVRAKAMAMHNSEHLAETIGVFYHELGLLSVTPRRCGLGLVDKETHITEISTMNTTEQGESIEVIGKLKMTGHPVLEGIYDNWLLQKEYHPVLMGNEIKEYYQLVRPQISYPDYPNDVAQYGYFFYFQDGGAFAWTDTELPEAELQIYRRFNSVLSLTYRRYKDIKEAEEQARESQIQLGLERVRAKAMAMQTSEELNELIGTVFGELTNLDFVLTRCLIMIFDPETNSSRWWMANSEAPSGPMNYLVQYHKNPAYAAYLKAWKARDLKWRYALKGKVKRDWDDFLFVETELSLLPDFVIAGMKAPGQVLLSASFNNFGCLTLVTLEPMSDEHSDIMLRFAKVFDMSYTRFNDLKQAEAQARESQIQLALERVRARTMAMQKSDELAETAMTLFQQFNDLGVKPERIFIGNMDENTRIIDFWGTEQGGNQMRPRFEVNADATIGFSQIYKAWKAKKKTHTVIMKGQELADHVHYVQDVLNMPIQQELLQGQRIMYSAFFSKGLLMIVTPEIQSDETLEILERFAGVFDGTYTRFLDLQKAEAQGREAQIQLALERVRARTMAMQKSDELQEVIQLIYEQLQHLNFNIDVANFALNYNETDDFNLWIAAAGRRYATKIHIPYFDHPVFNHFNKAKAQGGLFADTLSSQEKNSFFDHFFKYTPEVPEERKALIFEGQGFARSAALMKNTALTIINYSGIAYFEAENTILLRFGQVFDQTYTRFSDLKQAEAQAKDAKIEASLERVRSKTMAMHNSKDVGETVAVMFDELVKLGVETTARLGILIVDDTSHMEVWTASSDASGNTSMRIGRLDMTIHPILQGLHTAWKNKETVFSYPLAGEDMKAYYHAINNSPDYPSQFNLDNLPKQQEHNSFIFPEGAIFIFSLQPLATEITQIFKKFAGVFGQTYRRYLDLQKAETQAREAQIEASLERVRGKALAMYNSKDLSSTASLVFTELRKLGVNSKRCGVALLSKNSRHTQLYVATTTLDTDSLDLVGAIELSGHPSLEKQYESWLKNEDYFTVLKGEDLKSYKELIYSMLPVPYDHSYHEEFGYYLAFSEGFLFSWAEKPFSEIEINILNRFKSIIDLTFRRYIELQKSEANAREAVRQSSLDRVRAEIASMRTTGDLDRITPLIWNELTILGVPFIRCGVFIMDEPHQLIHTYLSTPEGKAIAAFQLHFNADNGSGVNGIALQGWRQKQAVTLHWTEEEFRNFSHSLMEQGEITSEENYLTEHPPTGLELHFFPFLQGMLYAGNTEPLSDDDKDLVQSLADAFSTAYARYEDFNRLELAKQQVEHTLSDLKSAQTKLVQSEKMASLGELTAGIAHEIQNPLNFVNNFSEVNQEMIEELEEELNAGNIEEALALAADIKQNEQKINHHGKRADGIVKGMLEHSRTGGGEKMPINMNTLADEFMRLSYHGLRAKDKAFNAEMVTSFDPDLPKINVVGQDMGRVILNLFNNAFYAVNQKKKTADPDYRPEVSVSTAAENGRVSITVKDNGIGIPDAIKEKIMQPFFTTKPTGEGTGLGLSLTYDMVVKGHGGSIQVNSAEGEGSEFIIQLPIN